MTFVLLVFALPLVVAALGGLPLDFLARWAEPFSAGESSIPKRTYFRNNHKSYTNRVGFGEHN